MISKATFQFILPSRCLACDDLVADQGALCGSCWMDMPFIEKPVCEKTGTPFSYDLGENIISAEAIANPPIYRKMRAAARYEGTARQLILAFKYYERLDLAHHLARYMIRCGGDILSETDVIVPVPLHRSRLFERRFNQSAELVKAMTRIIDKPHALEALKRIRPTRRQATLNMTSRSKNVEGAFRVPADQVIQIYGKRVLLVDDVMTTGATINACTRALLRDKAAHVDVITFAKVVELEDITI